MSYQDMVSCANPKCEQKDLLCIPDEVGPICRRCGEPMGPVLLEPRTERQGWLRYTVAGAASIRIGKLAYSAGKWIATHVFDNGDNAA